MDYETASNFSISTKLKTVILVAFTDHYLESDF